MPPDGLTEEDGKRRNRGGRPARSSDQQLRRDAIFLALSVLDELGAVSMPRQAPIARLANLIVSEDTNASSEANDQGLVLGFAPPQNLSSSMLQHAAKYTAQRVNDTVKTKKWSPDELASLHASSEIIVQMFLAPVQHAVDVLAQGLSLMGWPTRPVTRLSVLAKLWGAPRPGYVAPDAKSVQALAKFFEKIKKPAG